MAPAVAEVLSALRMLIPPEAAPEVDAPEVMVISPAAPAELGTVWISTAELPETVTIPPSTPWPLRTSTEPAIAPSPARIDTEPPEVAPVPADTEISPALSEVEVPVDRAIEPDCTADSAVTTFTDPPAAG